MGATGAVDGRRRHPLVRHRAGLAGRPRAAAAVDPQSAGTTGRRTRTAESGPHRARRADGRRAGARGGVAAAPLPAFTRGRAAPIALARGRRRPAAGLRRGGILGIAGPSAAAVARDRRVHRAGADRSRVVDRALPPVRRGADAQPGGDVPAGVRRPRGHLRPGGGHRRPVRRRPWRRVAPAGGARHPHCGGRGGPGVPRLPGGRGSSVQPAPVRRPGGDPGPRAGAGSTDQCRGCAAAGDRRPGPAGGVLGGRPARVGDRRRAGGQDRGGRDRRTPPRPPGGPDPVRRCRARAGRGSRRRIHPRTGERRPAGRDRPPARRGPRVPRPDRGRAADRTASDRAGPARRCPATPAGSGDATAGRTAQRRHRPAAAGSGRRRRADSRLRSSNCASSPTGCTRPCSASPASGPRWTTWRRGCRRGSSSGRHRAAVPGPGRGDRLVHRLRVDQQRREARRRHPDRGRRRR